MSHRGVQSDHFARNDPPRSDVLMRRLLETLPHLGVCTVGRAGYHAGLTSLDTIKAAARLSKAGLVLAILDGRLTPTIRDGTLLELTEEGRRAQLEMTAAKMNRQVG